MTIDLTRHCDPDRETIARPWSRGGYTYATQGHYAIRVPGEHAEPNADAPDLRWLVEPDRPPDAEHDLSALLAGLDVTRHDIVVRVAGVDVDLAYLVALLPHLGGTVRCWATTHMTPYGFEGAMLVLQSVDARCVVMGRLDGETAIPVTDRERIIYRLKEGV